MLISFLFGLSSHNFLSGPNCEGGEGKVVGCVFSHRPPLVVFVNDVPEPVTRATLPVSM